MLFLSNDMKCVRNGLSRQRGSFRRRGSVAPFVAFSLLLVVAYVGFSTDVMRNFLCVRKLQFAADSAACYAYSCACNADGSYAPDQAKANMSAALAQCGSLDSQPWNSAPSGPSDRQSAWESGVCFSGADISFVNNPNPDDRSELFLDVTARREGDDALRQFFLPAIYALNSLSGVPAGADLAKPYRQSEAVGQPASRIGQGPPPGRNDARALALSGFAVLPLAISNVQFETAAYPGQTRTTYVVDLFDSKSPQLLQPALPGHFKGCFVNVASRGGGAGYYGDAQGNLAIDQLIGLVKYFSPSADASAVPPAAVERGSKLSAFDPADPVFLTRKAGFLSALRQMPSGRYFIVPVLSGDPSFSSLNEVVGFARLRLLQILNQGGTELSPVFEIGESVPVKNACHANGVAALAPASVGTPMPAPVRPFVDRSTDTVSNFLSTRPRGVVLAPALSPRRLLAQ